MCMCVRFKDTALTTSIVASIYTKSSLFLSRYSYSIGFGHLEEDTIKIMFLFVRCSGASGLCPSQCLDQGKGLIPTPWAHSSAIPLGKRVTVHYLMFSDGTSYWRCHVCAYITLYTHNIISHFFMADDDECQTVQCKQQTREGNSLKPLKMCFLKN